MTVTVPRRIEPERLTGRSTQSWSLAFAEWTLLAIVLAIFSVKGFFPAWRTLNTDFPNYYVAAVLHHRGIPLGRVYEWTWFQRQKDHLGVGQPLVGFMPNPPMCALPILPLTSLSALAAKRVWLSLNIIGLLLALCILHSVTGLCWRRIFLISFLCVVPLQANFICGQYYVVILVLICGAYYASLSDHKFTSGLLLSAAASLKLFPALFLIMFVRKREWRSAAGLLLGGTLMATASVVIFGWDVHRVWLTEVLPRASHGDIIDPYAIQWASFSAVWHKIFLFEPALNPSPLLNSPVLYAIAQAVTPVLLVVAYLVFFDDRDKERDPAFEWPAFVSLLLLISSMPSSYHYCVLIFSAVVAFDAALKTSNLRVALCLLCIFAIICAPVPAFGRVLALRRLIGNFALYILLLRAVRTEKSVRIEPKWIGGAILAIIILGFSYWSSARNRSEDLSRRVSFATKGYSVNNPVPVGDEVVFTSMVADGYAALALQNGTARTLPVSKDILAVAGSTQDSHAFLEQVGRRSSIVRASLPPNNSADQVGEGESPSVSPDGKWLAFVDEEKPSGVWVGAVGAPQQPNTMAHLDHLLDFAVTNKGDLVASVGTVINPYLILLRHETNATEILNGIGGPARYPAVSPDGTHLAFTRRENGSWQLIVHDLSNGAQRQVTHASCNATSPAWESSQVLLYATDCGRGLGLSALARVTIPIQ